MVTMVWGVGSNYV